MATIPKTMFSFVRELTANNERDWFNANKKRYERELKDPALAFIDDFAPLLADVSPHFLAVPKATGGSLFRIYRDTRFSKDKTPYKTHVAMQFRHEKTAKDVHAPGFYLHLKPGGESAAGVGIWMPPNPVLNRIRDAIVADPARWTRLKTDLAAKGWSWMESDKDLKRVPRGYDKEHVHADDLKRKSFAVSVPFADEEVFDQDFAEKLAARYVEAGPLVKLLCNTLDLDW